jgi:hypothetical protein
MKRLVLPLFFAGVLLGLGLASASAAASTTTTIVHVDESFSETDTCGFQLDWRVQGSFKDTEFFDSSGTLVKLIETNTGGPFTYTITNPANGKTATTHSQTVVGILTFNPDGSLNTVTQNGIVFNFVLPGTGTIALDVGTVAFDSEGNLLKIGGPHQFLMGDVAGFCAALADP